MPEQLKLAMFGAPSRRRSAPDLVWLVSQLRANFYLGRLTTGDKLPPVRKLARQLHVSPTTALNLYKRLEDAGFVESRERSGTFLRQVANEGERAEKDGRLFSMCGWVIQSLGLLGVSPTDFCRLVLRYSGAAPREDFRFAFLCHHETFELVGRQLQATLGFLPPLVFLAAPPRERDARLLFGARPTVRCLLTTYPYSVAGLRLARAFDLQMLIVRLHPSTAQAFEPPLDGTRHIVTRDADFADAIRQLTLRVWGPTRAARLQVTWTGDHDGLAVFDRDATEILVSPLCLEEATARFHADARLFTLPVMISPHSIEDVLFHYVFQQGTRGSTGD